MAGYFSDSGTGPEEWPEARAVTGCLWLVGLFIFLAFGGMVFGPVIDRLGGWLQLRQFMQGCPRNEVRVEEFSWDGDAFKDRIDPVAGRTISDYSPGEDGTWRWFWFHGRTSVTHTLITRLRYPPAIPPAKFKQLLDSLNPPKPPFGESYRLQIHVAFWRGSQLYIYHYSSKPKSADLERLEQAIDSIPDQYTRDPSRR